MSSPKAPCSSSSGPRHTSIRTTSRSSSARFGGRSATTRCVPASSGASSNAAISSSRRSSTHRSTSPPARRSRFCRTRAGDGSALGALDQAPAPSSGRLHHRRRRDRQTALCEAFLRVAATRHAMRGDLGAVHGLRTVRALLSAVDLLTRLARRLTDRWWQPRWPATHRVGSRTCPRSPRTRQEPLPGTHVATAAHAPRGRTAPKPRQDTPLVLWIEDLCGRTRRR